MSFCDLIMEAITHNKELALNIYFGIIGDEINEKSASEMDMKLFNVVSNSEKIVMMYKCKLLCISLK